MAEIPFATKNAATGSEGYKWYVENGFDKKEFKGAKLLSGFVHGPGMLHSKKEIKSLSDIKGVKNSCWRRRRFNCQELGGCACRNVSHQSAREPSAGRRMLLFFLMRLFTGSN